MRINSLILFLAVLVLSSPGTATEPRSEANRLFVEAARLVAQAGASGDPRVREEAFTGAETHLEAIVSRHPESYLAVMLITGQQIGTISLPLVRSSAALARLEVAAAQNAETSNLAELEALDAELDKLNTAFAFLRNENATLYGALEKKESEVAALLSQQAVLSDQVRSKDQELAALAEQKQQQASTVERIAVLEADNAALTKSLRAERDKTWDLQSQIRTLTAAAGAAPSTTTASTAAPAPATDSVATLAASESAGTAASVSGTPVPTPRPASIETAAVAADAVQPAAASEGVAAAPAPAATYETASASEESPTETQQAAVPDNAEADQPQITAEEIAAAVKEALQVGTERVVSQVGQADGYNADPTIHIPLPQNLATVGEALKVIGLGGLSEDLELRLNRAAETAAPQAQGLFLQAIADMQVEDIQGIFQGSDDAATQYFQGAMSGPLADAMRPIIDDSLAQAGAVQAYDQMIGKYKSIPLVPDVKADLTEHVLTRAMDGLFYYLGQEEAAIRNDALKRTTELLQRVFGRS